MTSPYELALRVAQARSVGGTVTFVDFVEKQLDVKLTKAQRVLARVAFDGAEPRDLSGDERDIARTLFGDVETIPLHVRVVVVLVCGARAGKSYIFGALRLLHLAATVSLHTMAPGERASGLIVAPDIRLAQQTLRYASGAIKAGRSGLTVEAEDKDGFTVRRQDGKTVRIECLPATRGGSALRGRSLVGAVLDECAFFRDANYKVNDKELYEAVSPRILPGGGIVIDSTPWAEVGLLYTEFTRNWGNPQTAIAAHAPTLLLRDDDHTRSYVERERLRDPENAEREFGARFMPVTATMFFDPRAIDAAIDKTRALELEPMLRESAAAGGDFGFKRNSSALAISENDGALIHCALIREIVPPKTGPLVPSAVVQEFSADVKRYGCDGIVADGHYREAIREHLDTHDLTFLEAPEGADGKLTVFTTTRAILHEGRLRLPDNERMRSQLREVHSKPTSGGGMTIVLPKSPSGAHGDIVSALVLSVWKASKLSPRLDAELGSAEHMKEQARKRFQPGEQHEVEQFEREQSRGRRVAGMMRL